MTTLYNLNDVIIRYEEMDAENLLELELHFPNTSLDYAVRYRVAALYTAFIVQPVNFVSTSSVYRTVALTENEFSDVVQQRLVNAVLLTHRFVSPLYDLAQQFLYGDMRPIVTNNLPLLEPYKRADLVGQAFGDAWVQLLREKGEI